MSDCPDTPPLSPPWELLLDRPFKLSGRTHQHTVHQFGWSSGESTDLWRLLCSDLFDFGLGECWAIFGGDHHTGILRDTIRVLDDSDAPFFLFDSCSSGNELTEINFVVRVTRDTLERYIDPVLDDPPWFLGLSWWRSPPIEQELRIVRLQPTRWIVGGALTTHLMLVEYGIYSRLYTSEARCAEHLRALVTKLRERHGAG